jgi:class 3 adenylate cyclase
MPGGEPTEPDADHTELVEYLKSIGFSDDEIAVNDTTLASLASRRVLFGDERRVTNAELAAEAGCSEELARRVRLAAGLPGGDGPICSPRLIEVMRAFVLGASLLGEDVVLQFTRVVGNATATIAEAALATFTTNRQAPLLQRGAPLSQVAREGAEATTALLAIPPVLDVLLRLHFENAVTGRFASEAPRPTIEVAIGFVDLVESTRLTLSASGEELAAALSDFERDASDAVVGAGGRVVKRIGDAVMFVTSSPDTACRVAATVIGGVVAHPRLESARAAVTFGSVLPRDGDYFGSPVNVAARAVPIAEPGSIVVTREVADALPTNDWRVVDLGAHALKGFDDPVELFAVSSRD